MNRDERYGSEKRKVWAPPKSMTEKEFQRFSEFIQSEFGIKMPLGKKTMLESRLNKRLRALNMSSHKEYEDYIFSLKGMDIELPHLIDVVTTSKTDFFREPKHFEILYNELLPEWDKKNQGRKTFTAWSAGCSTGEEPYTLAMVLGEFAQNSRKFDFEIVASDISNQVLDVARRAIYSEDKISEIPYAFRKKFLLKSKDRKKKLMRIIPELRKRVKFRQLNFMENFNFREKMDIIFCRNVIIYFERPIQEVLFEKFCRHLNKDGFIFIGHSETLAGMELPLEQYAPTVYRKRQESS